MTGPSRSSPGAASSGLQLASWTPRSEGPFALDATASVGDTLTALGYPAAGKYHGNDLVLLRRAGRPGPVHGRQTYRMACDMTGGAPAGRGSQCSAVGGVLSSLNSYGYSGVKNMYGPKFNAETTATFNAADGATSGNIPVGP